MDKNFVTPDRKSKELICLDAHNPLSVDVCYRLIYQISDVHLG